MSTEEQGLDTDWGSQDKLCGMSDIWPVCRKSWEGLPLIYIYIFFISEHQQDWWVCTHIMRNFFCEVS